MTEDLEAIDVLSERYLDAIRHEDRYDHVDAIVLIENASLISQGEKVLRMYESEALNSPNDLDVQVSLSRHLYRIGWMYYEAVIPRYLQSDSNAGSMGPNVIHHANSCCLYMLRSYEVIPSSGAAFILADMFRMAGFYGSAIYWLKEAERVSAEFDNVETATKAKASRLDLQADGKTVDPPLARRYPFPTGKTPGLMLPDGTVSPLQMQSGQYSPAVSQTPSSASTSSGCGGATAILIVVCGVVLTVLHH